MSTTALSHAVDHVTTGDVARLVATLKAQAEEATRAAMDGGRPTMLLVEEGFGALEKRGRISLLLGIDPGSSG